MTTAHPDLAALTRAVCEFPDDDTPRLVCADWLDEHEQHERAEFIRVQCELSRTPDPHCLHCWPGNGCVFHALQRRANELLDARRREWSGIKRPVCDGATVAGHAADGWSSLEQCDHCTGTGAAPFEFARGFVDRVRCRMGDVLRAVCGLCAGSGRDRKDSRRRCPRCSGTLQVGAQYEPAWTLTPWARGVLNAHPVTRWEIVDREPYHNGRGHSFYDESRPDSSLTVAHGANIPTPVFKEMLTDHNRANTHWVHYQTAELARDALARAVGRVARRLAGLSTEGLQ